MTVDAYLNSDANSQWDDPFNWSTNTLPVPGDIAVLAAFQQALFPNLSLFDVNVALNDGSRMQGNYLSLAGNTSIEGVGESTPSLLDVANIVTGRMTFIGDNIVGAAGLGVDATTIHNNGTIGAEAGGLGSVGVETSNIVNTGQLIASNGGELHIGAASSSGATISGSGGQINVQSGATLELFGVHVAGSQKLDLGGEAATTLSFDPFDSSIAAKISDFQDTDIIDLRNFVGQKIKASSTLNPTLTITGSERGSLTPSTFTLGLIGNYTNEQFSLLSDGGSGTFLTVNLT